MRIRGIVAVACVVMVASTGISTALAEQHQAYPQTVEALKQRYLDEVQAHRKYSLYARKAADEDHPHIAHLFNALATSEAIHARNFQRLLRELGVGPGELPDTALTGFEVGSTKENLKHATAVETEEIDKEYPSILEAIKSENHEAAITNITRAWKAEQQHRGLMVKIQAGASTWFGMLATVIENKAKRYYVCQVCGSLVTTLPKEQCPICGHPHTEYQEVPGYPGRPEQEEQE